MIQNERHSYDRKIKFSETDAAGVVHFTVFPGMVEEAEHDYFFLRGVKPFEAGRGWPRVGFSIRYAAPCYFGEVLQIRLGDFEIKRSSLRYGFFGDKAGRGQERVEVFSGEMTICYVEKKAEGGEGFAAVAIPDAIRRMLVGEGS